MIRFRISAALWGAALSRERRLSESGAYSNLGARSTAFVWDPALIRGNAVSCFEWLLLKVAVSNGRYKTERTIFFPVYIDGLRKKFSSDVRLFVDDASVTYRNLNR